MAEKTIKPLGDSHNGQQVTLVTEGGKKYLIKPKSAAVQTAMEAFLAQLGREGFPFLPRCETTLEVGEGYYKTAFEENRPAASQADVTAYFHRCGCLLFLAYMLSAADLHCENIIACQNTPVLIDVENILAGRLARPVHTAWKNLAGSVTDSSLLPHWMVCGTEPIQCGGLCSEDSRSPSTLKHNHAVVPIYAHIPEVLAGFTAAYTYALAHKAFLTEALQIFSPCPFRILLRQTEAYAKLISATKAGPEPEQYAYAAALLERAYRNDFRPNRLAYMRKACDAEIRSVLRGDIPYFYVQANGTALCADGEEVAQGFFEASPLDCAKAKILALSPDDLRSQAAIIEQCLSAVKPVALKERTVFTTESTEKILFEKLEKGRIAALSAGWIMLDRIDDRIYIKSVDNGLYGGLSGILCAYAAFYYKTQNPIYLDALLTRYQPLSDYIRQRSHPVSLKNHAVCLQNGAAGMIQALLHMHELTGENVFLQDALKIASLLAVEGEAGEGDLLGGAAGLALCLSKLPNALAAPLAEKLTAPLSAFSPPLTGAAHGLAGAALALAALQNAAGTTAFDNRVLELLQKENADYDAAHNNWRDLRNPEGLYFMNGWCAGAPGIGMTRKKILQYTTDARIAALCQRDLAKVQQNLAAPTALKRDGLCCGNAARLMACSALGVKNDTLYSLLAEKSKNDTLCFDNLNNSCMEDYSLMQGLAGVGYALAMYRDEKCGGMLL